MAGLHFDITADNTNLIQKLNETESRIKSASKAVEQEGGSIEALFSRMAKAAAAFGAGFTAKELIQNVIRVRGEFQQLEVAFTTMLGSQGKATALMSQLTETAAKTPFDLQGVANGARQLLAYGTAADDVNETLVRLGNIAAGLSIPLNDLVYLYGTTMTQGRLYTEDLNQFTGRGIPMIRELAKEFGVAESEIKAMVEAGKIGFPEVQKVINRLTDEGGMFFNLMQEQSKTITGQISNIGDGFSMMLNEIGKSNEGIINDALGGVSYLIENYETVGKTLLEIVGTYGAYKAALITITALHKAYSAILAQSALNQSLAAASGVTLSNAQALAATRTKLLQIAQAALNKTLLANPYVLAAAAVAALGVGIYKLVTYQTEAEKAQERLNDSIKEYDKSLASEQIQIDELFGRLKAATKGTDEWKEAKDAIMSRYGEYLKGLGDEETALNNIALAYDTVTKAVEKSAKARAMNSFVTEEADKLAEVRAEALSNVRKELDEAFGDAKGKDGIPLADTYFWRIKPVIDGDEYIHQIDDIKKALYDAGASNEVYQNINKAVAAAKQYKKSIEAARENWGDVPKTNENTESPFSIEGKSISQLEEETGKAQARLEELKKSLADGSGTKEAVTEQEAYIKSLQDTVLEREKDLKVISEVEARISKLKKEQKETVYGSKEYNSLQSRINALDAKLPQTKAERNEANKAKEAQQKLSDELLELRRRNQKAETDLMEEGTEKKLKQINDDYEAQKAEIEKKARELAELNRKSGMSGTNANGLTTEQQEAINEANKLNGEKRTKETNEVYAAEAEAMREYLREYGTFQQQKLAIAEEYAEKIAKAGGPDTWQGKALQKQLEESLASLDFERLKDSIDWEKVFGNLDRISTSGLESLREQLERYIETQDNLSPDILKEVVGAINEIDGKLKERNPFGSLSESLGELSEATRNEKEAQEAYNRALKEGTEEEKKNAKETLNAAKNLKQKALAEATESMHAAVDNVRQYVSVAGDVMDIMGQFGIDPPEWLEGYISGTGKMLDGLSQIDLTKPASIITGGIKTLSGAIEQITSLGGVINWNGSNAKEVQETIDRLTDRNDALRESMDALNDTVKAARGTISTQAARQSMKYQQEINDNLLEIAKTQAGYHGSHHSWSYYWGGFTDEQIDRLSGQIGRAWNGDIWNLSPEEMQTLKGNVDMWELIKGTGKGGYGEQVAAKLDDYIEQAGELEAIANSLYENLTGISFDSLYDSFIDTLMDMDASAEDFAEDFSGYMMRAMLSNKVGEQMYDEIEAWYQDFGKRMEGYKTKYGGYAIGGIWSPEYEEVNAPGLDEADLEALQKSWEEIVNKGLAMRDELAAATGYDKIGQETQEQQSATSKGFETMTQDQASELNGRFTALYEVGLQILNNIQYLLSISVSLSEQNSILIEIRNLIISSNGYLEDIAGFQKKIWEKVDLRMDTINETLNSKL